MKSRGQHGAFPGSIAAISHGWTDAQKTREVAVLALFQTQSLCKYYRAGGRNGVKALDDVSVAIDQGTFTVLTGSSGSGKTTLLALLGALERPTRGQVIFDGRKLGDCSDTELTRIRRRMGFVFQNFSLIANLSVIENITYPLIPRGIARAERDRRAQELTERLGISGRLRARARELSGGEQQRVAVARALAGQPEVILGDEPTSNLDPASAEALLTLFREIHQSGKTMVLVSHDPQVVALATAKVNLQAGKVTGEEK